MLGILHVVLAVVLAAGSGESAAREQARKAAVAADLGQYDKAAHLYEKAYETHQDPGFLFRLAECLRLAGKLDRAREVYRSFLKAAGGDAADRAAAEARLAELEGKRAPAATAGPEPAPRPASGASGSGRRDGLARYRAATVRVFAVARPTCEPFGYSSRCIPLLGHGSGLLFRAGNNVFVLTNKHVVRDLEGEEESGKGKSKGKGKGKSQATAPETALAVQLPNDARYFAARPVYEHPSEDVAVLRVQAGAAELGGLRDLAVVPDVAAIAAGEGMTVIGYPKEAVQDDPTSLEGTCSGVWKGFEKDKPVTLTRTSAPVNEGESGGPAINAHGQLVGIVVAHIGEAQGLGLLISSAAIQETMAGLRRVSIPAAPRVEPAYAGIAAAGGALNKYVGYFFQHKNMAAADEQAEAAKRFLESAAGADGGASDAHVLLAWLGWVRVRLHAERMTKDNRVSDDDFKQTVRGDYRAACPDITRHIQDARLDLDADRRTGGIGAVLSDECRLLASGDVSLTRGQPWYAPVPTVGLGSGGGYGSGDAVEEEQEHGDDAKARERGAGITAFASLAVAQQTSSESATSGQVALRFGGTRKKRLEVGYLREPLYPMAPRFGIAHAYVAGSFNGIQARVAALGDAGWDMSAGQLIGPVEYGFRLGSTTAQGLCNSTFASDRLGLFGFNLLGHVPFDDRAELTFGTSVLLATGSGCPIKPSLLEAGGSFAGWLTTWLGGSVHASYLRLIDAPVGPVAPGAWGGATSIGTSAAALGVGARIPVGALALVGNYDAVVYSPAVHTVRLGMEVILDARPKREYWPPAPTWPGR